MFDLGAGSRRSASVLVGAGVALILVGCGPVAPSPSPTAPTATASPDFVRRLSAGASGAWRLLVYDPAGLLVDVQQQLDGTDSDPNIRWDPIVGSPESLVLAWMGGVCTSDRTLTIGKQGSHVSLAVFEGHNRPLAAGEACPAVGIIYRFRLTFRRPISSFDLSVAYSELPQ